MKPDYKNIETPVGTCIEVCPCCGSEASLFRYSEIENGPTQVVVMCSNGDPIGQQEGIVYAGCPLYMPNNDFYCATVREAVRYWNNYAKALNAIRRRNRWAKHSAIRKKEQT